MRGLRAVIAVLGLIGALAAAAWFWIDHAFRAPGPLPVEVLVLVPPGTGLRALAERLAETGAIASPAVFVAAVRLHGAARMLQAGEYAIPPRASMEQIAARMRAGDVHYRRLTVPEGLTVRDAFALIESNAFLTGALPVLPQEGSLAPDTYFFRRGDSRSTLVARMAAIQEARMHRLWAERAPALPLESPAAALVLASIIERETGLDSERARIAGVFVNRLRRGMRLQSDPTVIYGISGGSGRIGRALSRADLKHASPYNTYRRSGLPPGPIALPGLASMQAALQPEDTDALYFVADGTGGHAFARTLDEHRRNVARWKRLQRAGEAN